MTPLVRVVVLAHNGLDLTERCLDSLGKLDWPTAHLEIVVVDNASTDSTAGRVSDRYPHVRLLRSARNRGFAGGNNLALRDLSAVDYVGLLNNDVVVDPAWLRPLVETFEENPGIGAACPKILFDAHFFDVALSTQPDQHDGRQIGVCVCGVAVPSNRRLPDPQYVRGFYDPQPGPGDGPVRWSAPTAGLRVPITSEAAAPSAFRMALRAERSKKVFVMLSDEKIELDVGPSIGWFELPVRGPFFEVVNNVGSVLYDLGHGGDRGYCERDDGRYGEPAEVFGWCGGSVLLSTQYLADVGLFDERFFLYYEDLDLSWRGRARGWRYLYEPRSVVRHVHAASTVEHSALFLRYVERNRLLMLVRNAPKDLCRRALLDYLRTMWPGVGDPAGPPGTGRPGALVTTARRLRVLAELGWLGPVMLRSRRRLRARQFVADDEILTWAVQR